MLLLIYIRPHNLTETNVVPTYSNVKTEYNDHIVEAFVEPTVLWLQLEKVHGVEGMW